jgi:hypothetical protein
VIQNPDGSSSSSSDGTVANPSETFANVRQQIQNLNIPIGWTTTPIKYDSAFACNLSDDTTYDDKGNPITITGIHVNDMCYPIVNALPLTKANWIGWLTKLLGILLTGAAAAQGAPFWFDILKKLINVRSSGANPAEEKPKG